jgi:hypothetical protein
VVATSYLLGVSTRPAEKLAESLGVTKLSMSQVKVMASELDEMAASFRSWPVDARLYAFVWIDALPSRAPPATHVDDFFGGDRRHDGRPRQDHHHPQDRVVMPAKQVVKHQQRSGNVDRTHPCEPRIPGTPSGHPLSHDTIVHPEQPRQVRARPYGARSSGSHSASGTDTPQDHEVTLEYQ